MRHFFILLVALSSLSCKGYTQQARSEKFLKQINQAELAIVNNQAERAYKIYKKFSLKQLKLKDLNNFYLLALQNKEIEMGVQIAAEIVQRGVGSTYFTKSMFTPLKANSTFQERIKNAINGVL